MSQDKELLLKDLCARLPYGVKVQDRNGIHILFQGDTELTELFNGRIYTKPYLFPLSSMTEEEKKEFIHCAEYEVEESVNGRHYEYYLKDYVGTPENPSCNYNAINWLNKNHYDYNDWIARGLGICANEKNIYNFEK